MVFSFQVECPRDGGRRGRQKRVADGTVLECSPVEVLRD
jgi:hypothetical protein